MTASGSNGSALAQGCTAACRWSCLGELVADPLLDGFVNWARPFGNDLGEMWIACERPDWLLQLAAVLPVPIEEVIAATCACLEHELHRVRVGPKRRHALSLAGDALYALKAFGAGSEATGTCYDAVGAACEAGPDFRRCERTGLDRFVGQGLHDAAEMLGGDEGQIWRAALLHVPPGEGRHGVLVPDRREAPRLVELIRQHIEPAHVLEAARRYSGDGAIACRVLRHVPVSLGDHRPWGLWFARFGEDAARAWRLCPWPAWQMALLMARPYRDDWKTEEAEWIYSRSAAMALVCATATREFIPDILPGAEIGSLQSKAAAALMTAMDRLNKGSPGAPAPDPEHERLLETLDDAFDGIDRDFSWETQRAVYALEAVLEAVRGAEGWAEGGRPNAVLFALVSATEASNHIDVPLAEEKFGWMASSMIREEIDRDVALDLMRRAAEPDGAKKGSTSSADS